MRWKLPGFDQLVDGDAQRHPGARNGGGAGAAIGLDDVAVQCDLALAQGLEIDHGAQGAPDKALNFLRPAGLLAARCLAPPPCVGRARQHAIFGGDPALALAAKPGRKAGFDRGGAQHAGVAEADEAASLGVAGEAGFHGDRPHLIGRASGWAHVYPFGGSRGALASPPSSFQRKLESPFFGPASEREVRFQLSLE